MQQVRADLERLRHIVDSSWIQDRHCLLVCMKDMWPLDSQYSSGARRRRFDMIRVLDFQTPREMYRWNDEDGRIKAHVLDRIDGAL